MQSYERKVVERPNRQASRIHHSTCAKRARHNFITDLAIAAVVVIGGYCVMQAVCRVLAYAYYGWWF